MRGGSGIDPESCGNIIMAKKLLIITDDAGESYEILYAYHRFLEAGWEPRIAATQKKLLNAVIHDFAPGWNTYIEKPGYSIQSHLTFSQVRVKDYEALMVIGGRAPEFLRHDPKLIKLVQGFHAQNKWLFAICHGIQVLLAAGVVKGMRVTCYRNVRWEAQAGGAEWVDEQSVVDGKIITAQTWESHPAFYRHIFENLEA